MERRLKVFLLVLSLAMVVVVPQALAAKGGNGGNGGGGKASIWIQEDVTARAADGSLRFEGEVMFGYETTYSDDRGRGPWIELQCKQDGEVVYREWRAAFDGGYRYGEPHNLGPSEAWQEGEADCTGILGHYSKNFSKFMKDATVDFHVMP